MSVHDDLREIWTASGVGIDDPDLLWGYLEDVVRPEDATPGELRLLYDAVRFGSVERVASMAAKGAAVMDAIDHETPALAQKRGSRDVAGPAWALACFAYARGDTTAEVVAQYYKAWTNSRDNGKTTRSGLLGRARTLPAAIATDRSPLTQPSAASQGSSKKTKRNRRRPVVVLVVATAIATLLVAAALIGEGQAPEGAQDDRKDGANPAATVPSTSSPTEVPTGPDSGAGSGPATTDPLLQGIFNPPKPRDIANIGSFLKRNVQRVVRIDVAWWPPPDAPGDSGQPAIWADCLSSCEVGELGAVLFEIDGLDEGGNEARFVTTGGERSLLGRFFVETVVLGTGGIYEVGLRVASAEASELPVRGRCDVLENETVLYPGSPFSSVTNGGQFSQHVLLVQDLLNALGYGCLKETGYFDTATDQAVRTFQRENVLGVDGIVGADTYNSLILTQENDIGAECFSAAPPDYCP